MLCDSYNSFNLLTHTIYWLTNQLKNSLDQLTGQMEKRKKVSYSSKGTFYKRQYLKPSNINLASVSVHFRKKLSIILTQLIDTIY